MDFRKNLWQVFVLPMYEFALPIYSAETAITRREGMQRHLRASFRSYIGLKKTVKLDLMLKLMGYNLEERSEQLQYISEQKWKHRCDGEIYNLTSDTNPIVQKKKPKNVCRRLPRVMIKYINMQTSLCPLCKECEAMKQCTAEHLAKVHNITIKTTQELIQDLEEMFQKIESQKKSGHENKSKREIMLESAERYIQTSSEKLKQFLVKSS